MKPGIIFCLALFSIGGLPACGVSIVSSQEHKWGESAGGLQMAAAMDTKNGVIHCWIRNGGPSSVSYIDFFFGYSEDSVLQIHQGKDWVQAPFGRLFPGLSILRGAFPSDMKVQTLASGQIMLDTWTKRDETLRGLQKEKSYNEWLRLCHGDAKEARLAMTEEMRRNSVLALARDDTFAFDIVQCPSGQTESLRGQKNLEMRVAQMFYPPANHPFPYLDDKTEVVFYSPTFVLSHIPVLGEK